MNKYLKSSSNWQQKHHISWDSEYIFHSHGGSKSSQVLDKKGRGRRLILCASKLRVKTAWMQQLEGASMEQRYEETIMYTEAAKWSIY